VPGAAEPLVIETGEIGRLAGGAVMVSAGETMVYATACSGPPPSSESGGSNDGSFVPLQVHYQERFSAAGRTSGSYLKREGRPRDSDVLVSRLVDRPIRPMFDKGWAAETQVLEWLLSYDGRNEPEPLAITAAAAALLVSDIPLKKAVAGVRVAWIGDDEVVINPTAAQMAASRLDLMLAGTADAVLMIEGFCDLLTEEQMLRAVQAGAEACASVCRQLQAWADAENGGVGRRPQRPERVLPPRGLADTMRRAVGDDLERAFAEAAASGGGKEARAKAEDACRRRAYEAALAAHEAEAAAAAAAASADPASFLPRPPSDAQLGGAWKQVVSGVMRRAVLRGGKRADGRALDQVRPISCRASPLPRVHGSALFTRGETQVLCVATLGTASDAQKVDGIRASASSAGLQAAAAAAAAASAAASLASASSSDDGSGATPPTPTSPPTEAALERFYLQYYFPPSCVGEVGRIGPAGRRELGHGELAQRALAPVVPPHAQFPYTVRVESTVTESNGSSSMASVCGGCLAMLDAGVPLLAPVAGVAMGLILNPREVPEDDALPGHVVLTDILGSEDALGDMDFKVAGTAEGVTAFQMDIKVEGITIPVLREALEAAKKARAHILGEMEKRCDPPPRGAISAHAPQILTLRVEPSKIGAVIGSGGKNVRAVCERSGATAIDVDQSGAVSVSAPTRAAAEAARDAVLALADALPPGTLLKGRRVMRAAPFGVFVEVAPNKEGLVHVSELMPSPGSPPGLPPADPSAAAPVGSEMDVVLLGVNPDGRVRLSQKAAHHPEGPMAAVAEAAARATAGGGGGGGRGGGGRRNNVRDSAAGGLIIDGDSDDDDEDGDSNGSTADLMSLDGGGWSYSSGSEVGVGVGGGGGGGGRGRGGRGRGGGGRGGGVGRGGGGRGRY
jgi:polyribonucleotide nucleotidyltransferase